MNKKNLKIYLENLYARYRNKYSSKDPVWNIHEFKDEKDIEIAGLITSCYAYGQVDQINVFVNKFLRRIDHKAHEFTSNFSQQKDKKYLKDLCYRFNTEEDLSFLLCNIKAAVESYGSLKDLFLSGYDTLHTNVIDASSKFATVLNTYSPDNPSYKYLVTNPLNGSACKRLMLYLRWMIRKDEIDTGVWADTFSPSKLIMPVDTHIYRISINLKLVKRRTCDMKFAIELTEKLKQFDVNDPVKYDFALCHAGIDS